MTSIYFFSGYGQSHSLPDHTTAHLEIRERRGIQLEFCRRLGNKRGIQEYIKKKPLTLDVRMELRND